MIKLVRNMISAAALYTRIPMPRLNYREGDYKYALFFLPWVGGLLGILLHAVTLCPGWDWAPLSFQVCVVAALPLLVTGGFHLDGYMDVQDALRSYKTREEKLAILKDPHIGAFAVVGIAILAILWFGGTAMLLNGYAYGSGVLYFVFFHGRALGAFAALVFKRAKKDGLLAEEAKKANWWVLTLVVLETLFMAAITLLVCGMYAVWMAVGMGLAFVRCVWIAYRQFGGFSGDSIGWLIVSTELGGILGAAFAVFMQ